MMRLRLPRTANMRRIYQKRRRSLITSKNAVRAVLISAKISTVIKTQPEKELATMIKILNIREASRIK